MKAQVYLPGMTGDKNKGERSREGSDFQGWKQAPERKAGKP